MILLYIYFEVYFLNPKGLSDGKVVFLTKKNMLLQFIFIDVHEIFKGQISDEWFNAIC